MRTEMVIRIQASSEKDRANKAMEVAAAIHGVKSVTTLTGSDKRSLLLVVIGDGVDCYHLTSRLRRKVGHVRRRRAAAHPAGPRRRRQLLRAPRRLRPQLSCIQLRASAGSVLPPAAVVRVLPPAAVGAAVRRHRGAPRVLPGRR
ncbi:hypothetical protein ACP70R_026974 [Stipagrostis hirtigluma subsp. patula]